RRPRSRRRTERSRSPRPARPRRNRRSRQSHRRPPRLPIQCPVQRRTPTLPRARCRRRRRLPPQRRCPRRRFRSHRHRETRRCRPPSPTNRSADLPSVPGCFVASSSGVLVERSSARRRPCSVVRSAPSSAALPGLSSAGFPRESDPRLSTDRRGEVPSRVMSAPRLGLPLLTALAGFATSIGCQQDPPPAAPPHHTEPSGDVAAPPESPASAAERCDVMLRLEVQGEDRVRALRVYAENLRGERLELELPERCPAGLVDFEG